jgi:hypothetical protein
LQRGIAQVLTKFSLDWSLRYLQRNQNQTFEIMTGAFGIFAEFLKFWPKNSEFLYNFQQFSLRLDLFVVFIHFNRHSPIGGLDSCFAVLLVIQELRLDAPPTGPAINPGAAHFILLPLALIDTAIGPEVAPVATHHPVEPAANVLGPGGPNFPENPIAIALQFRFIVPNISQFVKGKK